MAILVLLAKMVAMAKMEALIIVKTQTLLAVVLVETEALLLGVAMVATVAEVEMPKANVGNMPASMAQAVEMAAALVVDEGLKMAVALPRITQILGLDRVLVAHSEDVVQNDVAMTVATVKMGQVFQA